MTSNAPVPLTNPSRASMSEWRRNIVTQMRFSRRLQQAIEEGARAAVLRNALAQARNVGCGDSILHAPIVRRGEALLPQVEALEAVNCNGPHVQVDATLPRLLGSATANPRKAKLPLAMSNPEEALHSAIASKCSKMIQAAIDLAETSYADSALIAQAKAVLAECIYEEQERIRTQLSTSAQELLELASKPGLFTATLNVSISTFRELVETGRASRLGEEELARFSDAIPTARKTWARVTLQSALEEARSIDIRNDDLELVVAIRNQLFEAVVNASSAGLLEADLREADTYRGRIHQVIEDRKGVVRLYCRVRPVLQNDPDPDSKVAVHCRDSMTVELDDGEAKKCFSFDACWAPGSQEAVFDESKDLVQSAVDGYNATIFAFGQTGSGKTYTMYGEKDSKLQGICPRAVDELFAIVGQKQERYDCTVSLTMLELYSNRLYDLLDIGSKKHMRIRTGQSGNVYVENAHEQVVASAQEVRRLMEEGSKGRHCRNTQMNTESSRSHVLFTLKVTSANRETGECVSGKLLLVDLAGSERVKRSGVTGDGLREACEINASLSALGDVLHALIRNDRHVPYRNHELTQLMQDSLGGTAKTLMFVNVSPTVIDLSETLLSLKFAQRAKGVVNDYSSRGFGSPRNRNLDSATSQATSAFSMTKNPGPISSRTTLAPPRPRSSSLMSSRSTLDSSRTSLASSRSTLTSSRASLTSSKSARSLHSLPMSQ